MQQLRAIIFDLDGTIANTLPLCVAAFRKSVEPLTNRSLSDADIMATFGPSEEGTIMALVPEHYEQGLADYLQQYEALHNMCPRPFDGVGELLQTLRSKGVRMAMVTGKGKHSTDISLKQFGLSNFFEMVETGSPHGPRKAEGIRSVLHAWSDIETGEVVYVGDAPSDIAASRQASVAVLAAAWGTTAEPELLQALQPDELFYSIADFSRWIYSKI